MNIEFQNKPTTELVARFCKKIEEFLLVHNLSLTIELWNYPIRIESYWENEHSGTTYCWVKKCKVHSDNFGDLEVRLLRQGIEESVDDYDIWNEAGYVQGQIYQQLKLDPGNPKDNDPYWNLWKFYPKD